MPSVTKEPGRGKKRTLHYRVEFTDRHGKDFCLRGIDYKPAADAVADKVGTLQQLHSAGERPTPELVTWIRDCRPEWRAKLIRAGIVDARLIVSGRSLGFHLLGFWHTLKAKGRTRDHARKTVHRILAVCRGAELRYLPDMTVSAVETYLAGLRDNGKGIGASTYNAYLQAVRQFSRWMVRTNRADADPLANAKPLERAKVRKECRRERRAATPDEMRELLTCTAAGPDRFGTPGADRRLVYWFAAMTGLRVREIKSLRVNAFDFGSKPPTVTIQARSAKNATTATLPLPVDLANALRPHLAGKTPAAPAFKLPHPSNFARMLTEDLEAARQAWIAEAQTPDEHEAREQSDNLAKYDHEGRALDFHALRHTRGVWLFQHHGASPREAQELMRVSSIALVDRYARSFRLRDMSLIDRGPELFEVP